MYAEKFDNAYFSADIKQSERLIKECEEYLQTHKSDYRIAPLHYHIATTYSDLQKFDSSYNNDTTVEKVLYHYRKAIDLIHTPELDVSDYEPWVKGFKLQLYTNYGVALGKCDRKLAAIKCYRDAMEINPNFAMSCGNMGIGLLRYSYLLHDNGHKNFLNHFAYSYLRIAANDKSESIEPAAKELFKRTIDGLDKKYVEEFLEKDLEIPNYSLGRKSEQKFRLWCLKNHLFLNPLNDLPLEHSCFAADTLQLPPIITSIEEREIPIFFGMFNQIKEDYIYSRYLLYQFLTQKSLHFADKDTNLLNLYDYPQYSIRVENGKTAFKTLYALLDKISYFANTYWELGIKPRDVTFNSIWEEETKGKHKYQHKSLNYLENEALNSVRWIYKEFNEKFGDASNPMAKELKTLRHALEHRYVKVHASLFQPKNKEYPYIDKENTYHISEEILGTYILRLIRIIRELIIDLTMAVHIEEKKKRDPEYRIGKMVLFEYDDKWKV